MKPYVTEFKRLGASIDLINDGTPNGDIFIPPQWIHLVFVGQQVILKSTTKGPLVVKVNQVVGNNHFVVGPVDNPSVDAKIDVSGFLVADNAAVIIPIQYRPLKKPNDIIQFVYAEEPAVAIRSLPVDLLGRPFTPNNPLPVQLATGNVIINDAQLNVQLTHIDNSPQDPFDSVRIGDGVATITGASLGPSGHYGLHTIALGPLVRKIFDKIDIVSKNDDGDPLVINFLYQNQVVATLQLTYDADGDLQSVSITQ